MRFRLTLSLVALTLLLGIPGYADLVVSSPSGYFVGGWAANNNGSEFWDHVSDDGTNCNIGFVLTGAASSCGNSNGVNIPLSPAPGTIPFLAADTAGAAAVTNFSFTPSFPGHDVTLQVEIAGNRGSNEFGYYTPNSSGGTLYTLFPGDNSPITSTSFTVSGDFGFYMKIGTTYFFSQSSLGSVGGSSNSDVGNQHFALFVEKPTIPSGSAGDGASADVYWIGVEDLRLSSSDKDYNDMVIKITAVPEPMSVLLFGTLLAGAGVLFRHHRKA